MSEQENIGSNQLGEVTLCECGGANLVMGPLTLHLAPEELPLLHDLVVAAIKLSVSQSKVSGRTGKPKAQGKTLH